MGKWSREFRRQIFGSGKKKRNSNGWFNERGSTRREANKANCAAQFDAAKQHARDLKYRKRR